MRSYIRIRLFGQPFLAFDEYTQWPEFRVEIQGLKVYPFVKTVFLLSLKELLALNPASEELANAEVLSLPLHGRSTIANINSHKLRNNLCANSQITIFDAN